MFELVEIVRNWLKLIMIVTFVTAVVSAGFSLILKDEFKSTTKIMPMNTNFLDKSAVFDADGTTRSTYLFGGEQDIDRLISLSESEELNQYLIEKYDLFNYYKISPEKKDAGFKLRERLRKNVKAIKSAKGHLEIEVYDKDPYLAARMANDVTEKLDEYNRRLLLEKKLTIRDLLGEKSSLKKQELDALVDSLKRVTKHAQADTVTAHVLTEVIDAKIEEYNGLRTNFNQYSSLVDLDISSIYYIEKAVPALKKDRPKRSLMVLGAAAVAFFFMTLWAVFLEKYKDYNKVYG